MEGMIQLLRLMNVLHEVQGRKKLQKIVHILKNTGYEDEFPQHYGYLHYGPYSEDVNYEVASLKKEKLIEETGSGEAYEAYVYKTKPENKQLLQRIGKHAPPAWANRAEQLNAKDTPLLEAMSTILFLQRNGFDDEKLKSRFGQIKPHLKRRFDAALSEVRKLSPPRNSAKL